MKLKNLLSTRITRPDVVPIVWVTFFFLCFSLFLELFSHTSWINTIIPFPSPTIDSSFPELDVKFQRLLQTKNVDCMFFGSSMVDVDLDPRLFEKQISQQGGSNLTCFNMGFSGSMVETSGIVATTISNWQPLKMVIFGVSPIEMDESNIEIRSIAKMPVFTYYNGSYTFPGWLFNTFRFPWYYASLPKLRDEKYLNQLAVWDKILDVRGQRRSFKTGTIPKDDQKVLLSGYKINPQDMEVFQSTITTLKNTGSTIVVIEMPVHPDFFPYLVEGGAENYQQEFIVPIEDFLNKEKIGFLRTQPMISKVVNNSHWINKNHLNFDGAEKFTFLISQKISNEGFLN